MKKIAAIVLLFAVMTVFVSCGKGNGDDNTTLPPYMGTSATTTQKTEESTTADKAANGYILTTDPNMTVSWGITTAFQTTLPTTVPSSGVVTVPSFTDNQNSTAYNPSMSQVSTTEKQPTQSTGPQGPTVVDAPDNTTKPVVPEEETTEAVTKQEKIVNVTSRGCGHENKTFIIEFDVNGWDGVIATRSTKVSVKYGSKTENASCTIKSGEIVVDISDLDITSGMTITVSVPEGAITTKSGSMYNRAFSISHGV